MLDAEADRCASGVPSGFCDREHGAIDMRSLIGLDAAREDERCAACNGVIRGSAGVESEDWRQNGRGRRWPSRRASRRQGKHRQASHASKLIQRDREAYTPTDVEIAWIVGLLLVQTDYWDEAEA